MSLSLPGYYYVGRRTSPTQQRITTTNVVYEEPVQCNQVSSISYHRSSHRMLVTTREPSNDPGVHFFAPRVTSPTEDRPLWELGSPSLRFAGGHPPNY
ncbi:hypothetical protein HYQ45_019010 [Verticillium longisporum]|uniref:Uncharacterized protein n=1 Tax=Verticillium longisporum TaxID=100787 RepID=A0A8I2Z4Y0_VERLO|nr:hypothetical protein HYQ45_019010 [Verticillium longisporum]